MEQTLAGILFFIVFIQLFIALSIYIWRTIYDVYMQNKKIGKNNDTQQ